MDTQEQIQEDIQSELVQDTSDALSNVLINGIQRGLYFENALTTTLGVLIGIAEKGGISRAQTGWILSELFDMLERTGGEAVH